MSSSICDSFPRALRPLSSHYIIALPGICVDTCGRDTLCCYCDTSQYCSNPSHSPRLSNREGLLRIALHFCYFVLIRDGLWDSTLNQSVLQRTLDGFKFFIGNYSTQYLGHSKRPLILLKVLQSTGSSTTEDCYRSIDDDPTSTSPIDHIRRMKAYSSRDDSNNM